MAVVSGWGGLKDQGETPNDLQFVPVPLFPENLCGGFMDHGLSDGMICAGYKAGGEISNCELCVLKGTKS